MVFSLLRKRLVLSSEQLAAESFRKALDELPEAIVLRGPGQRILFVNQKAQEVFRVRAADVVGRSMAELAQPATSRFHAAFSLDVASGKETRLTLPDGARVRAFIAMDIPVPVGNTNMMLRIFRETTREEEISRLKSQFMSVAAHQLRTPVATLQWVTQMLIAGEVGPISDAQRDLLVRASQTITHMARLISDLLDVTRIEEGRFAYEFRTEVNFPSFIAKIVESLQSRADAKKLTLAFRPSERPLPPLLIDPDRLSFAVENVIANAITYTFHGSVTVSVERRDRDVAIVVTDTGIGVSEKEQAKLFTKFFRAQNAMEMGIEGTGLGLFIVKNILQRHGGDAVLASQEGKGTTVTLLLPTDPQRVPSGDIPLDEVMI